MLNIILHRSKTLILLLALMHGSMGAVVAILPVPLWIKLAGMAGLFASMLFSIAAEGLRSLPSAAVRLQITADCRSAIQTRRGEWRDTEILGSSYVMPYLTVLNLRCDGSWCNRHVVIFPDAVDAEDFRKLRVLLRWKYQQETEPDAAV